MYSVEDVKMKFQAKESIERKMEEVGKKLLELSPQSMPTHFPAIRKARLRKLSESVELRRTPPPLPPAARYFPLSLNHPKSFSPVLQSRRSDPVDALSRRSPVPPSVPKTSFRSLHLRRTAKLA